MMESISHQNEYDITVLLPIFSPRIDHISNRINIVSQRIFYLSICFIFRIYIYYLDWWTICLLLFNMMQTNMCVFGLFLQRLEIWVHNFDCERNSVNCCLFVQTIPSNYITICADRQTDREKDRMVERERGRAIEIGDCGKVRL